MPEDKKLIRELHDVHERLIGVHHDHGGVRLDFGLTDRNLTISQAASLMVWLGEAIGAAQLWQDAQEPAGTGTRDED